MVLRDGKSGWMRLRVVSSLNGIWTLSCIRENFMFLWFKPFSTEVVEFVFHFLLWWLRNRVTDHVRSIQTNESVIQRPVDRKEQVIKYLLSLPINRNEFVFPKEPLDKLINRQNEIIKRFESLKKVISLTMIVNAIKPVYFWACFAY